MEGDQTACLPTTSTITETEIQEAESYASKGQKQRQIQRTSRRASTVWAAFSAIACCFGSTLVEFSSQSWSDLGYVSQWRYSRPQGRQGQGQAIQIAPGSTTQAQRRSTRRCPAPHERGICPNRPRRDQTASHSSHPTRPSKEGSGRGTAGSLQHAYGMAQLPGCLSAAVAEILLSIHGAGKKPWQIACRLRWKT